MLKSTIELFGINTNLGGSVLLSKDPVDPFGERIDESSASQKETWEERVRRASIDFIPSIVDKLKERVVL